MSDVPRVGDPPHLDVEQALSDMYVTLEGLKDTLSTIKTGEHQLTPEDVALEDETAALERQVKPLQRVWTALGVIVGILVVGAAAGVAYNQFVVDNVTHQDLESFSHEQVDPLEADVVQLKVDVSEVTGAVDTLVAHDKKQLQIEYKKALLDEYRSDYQECLSEYTALKAANKYAQRCKKDPRHIELEVELKTALAR